MYQKKLEDYLDWKCPTSIKYTEPDPNIVLYGSMLSKRTSDPAPSFCFESNLIPSFCWLNLWKEINIRKYILIKYTICPPFPKFSKFRRLYCPYLESGWIENNFFFFFLSFVLQNCIRIMCVVYFELKILMKNLFYKISFKKPVYFTYTIFRLDNFVLYLRLTIIKPAFFVSFFFVSFF